MEANRAVAEPSDEELMAQAQAGDIGAFEQLFDRYKQRIANFVFQFVGEHHAAEDVTQQVFIKIYQKLDRYQPKGKVSSWFYRIAANQAKDELRKVKRRPTVSLSTPVGSEEDGTKELGDFVLEDERQRPDHLLREKELLESIKQGLASMKPKYKEAILLCDYEGLSYEEAAEVMGITKTNVSAILCRARKKLQKFMPKA